MASDNQQLNQISTMWQLVYQAHSGQLEEANLAQMRLLLQYWGAVHRYLLGALRDPEAAEELGQEFALRFIRGDFQGADPRRGRFRDYLKTVLCRLVANYYKRRQQQPRSLSAVFPESDVAAPPEDDSDPEFLSIWRSELLDRAWQALAELQQKTGQPFHAVLQLRVEYPDTELPSSQIAERFSAQFGKKFTADGIRKLLQRAREKFAQCLLENVRQSLENPTPGHVEEELRDLGLLAYCRPALKAMQP